MNPDDRLRHLRALFRWIAASWRRPAATDARAWEQ